MNLFSDILEQTLISYQGKPITRRKCCKDVGKGLSVLIGVFLGLKSIDAFAGGYSNYYDGNLETSYMYYNKKGVQLLKKGEYRAAIPFLEKAYQMVPNAVPALMNLGYVHFKLQEWSKAKQYYERIIETQPEASAQYRLAADTLRIIRRVNK